VLHIQWSAIGDVPMQSIATARGHAHLREARHQTPCRQQHAGRNQGHPEQHCRVHRHARQLEMHGRGHHVHRQVQAHARGDDEATEPERHGMMEGDAHRRQKMNQQ